MVMKVLSIYPIRTHCQYIRTHLCFLILIKKFILLLRKVFYPYEYMDDWVKFSETTLPEKEEFYSNLNMEEVTDPDYMHGKRVCKDFELKKLGEYLN